MEKKFVVFGSEMDLKGHQLESHPNGMTKDARRDARLVDLSSFDYRAPYQETRGGRQGREGRGRGRGRDPNAEPLPPSTAQSMRRDELAYQRQMAIQSSQSIAPRNFGGQLTTQAARQPPSRTSSAQPPRTDDVPSVGSLTRVDNDLTSVPPPQQAQTPQEQARRLRHSTVMERAQNLLQGDSMKLNSFRDRVSAYQKSIITSEDLINAFFALFDVPSSELGKLVKELADIYEDEVKRTNLLKEWNNWRAVNEDYPSLPGPSGLPGLSSDSLGGGGKRVLKLKSSTAQSSRSQAARHGSWGGASGNSSNPFPGLPQHSSVPAGNRSGNKPSAAAWLASNTPSRSSTPKGTGTRTPTHEAFPALPATMKPNTAMAGLGLGGRGAKRWDFNQNREVPVNPWSTGGTPVQSPPAVEDNEEERMIGSVAGVKKKGKGKAKQTLFHFG